MAEERESSAEKSEEPTPKRLEKAREEGDTVRSKELNTAAILLTGAAGMILVGPFLTTRLSDIMAFNFRLPGGAVNDAAMLQHFGDSVLHALVGLLPLFFLLLVAAIVGPILLGGWNFTFKALAPKASRLNPLSGLARMFGPRALMELLKAIAKVGLVAAVAALVLYINTPDLLAIQQQAAGPAMSRASELVAWACLIMASTMLIITAIDVPFQVRQHTQKLRMTLQQVKEELKDTDGRPEVKQKIKQLQQQLANNRMMADLPMADVVITNPEHYAVALRYDQGMESAPRLLAKGVDLVAMKIREKASELDIPIVSAPPLARAVYYNTAIGDEIPEGLYVAVAQVLAYVYQLRQWTRGQGKRPRLSDEFDIPPNLRRDR